jgi:hypothetical protein
MSVSAPYGSLDATGKRPTQSLRAPTLIAGAALLLMVILSAWGNFGVPLPLLLPVAPTKAPTSRNCTSLG